MTRIGQAPALRWPALHQDSYVFMLAGGLISWSSKKRTTVLLPPTELEYVGRFVMSYKNRTYRTEFATLTKEITVPTMEYQVVYHSEPFNLKYDEGRIEALEAVMALVAWVREGEASNCLLTWSGDDNSSTSGLRSIVDYICDYLLNLNLISLQAAKFSTTSFWVS